MLDPLDEKTNLLYYNCFGVALVSGDQITVSVNAFKKNTIKNLTSKRELSTPLRNLERSIAIPFAAWVLPDEIMLTPGQLHAYDTEILILNKEIIEGTIKETIASIRGELLSKD